MGRPEASRIFCPSMESRGYEDRELDAVSRRYPEGSLVQLVSGRHRGDYAIVEEIDKTAFHELGEFVVWVDRGLGADYRPCSVMLHEMTPTRPRPFGQPASDRSKGVRNRGVTLTGPNSPASRSAAPATEPAASAPTSSSSRYAIEPSLR